VDEIGWFYPLHDLFKKVDEIGLAYSRRGSDSYRILALKPEGRET
jgi:hypothetical protein